MKIFMIALAMAGALTLPAHAQWRTPTESLYGGPQGDANSFDLRERARLDEALRKGTAGYVGNSTTNVISTTSAGCILNSTVTAEGPTGPLSAVQQSTCNVSGPVSGTTNVGRTIHSKTN